MKKILLRNSIAAGVLCTVLTVPSFAQLPATHSKDIEVSPAVYKLDHWSQTYIDELSRNYDAGHVFEGKDLNASINVGDFQKLVSLVIDEKYEGSPDAITREAVVYNFAKLWAEKTGKNLESIPVIKMIIYSDTNEIDAKYNQGVTVAYMKNIAKGKGNRIFSPKDFVTYGELAALMSNTYKAIEDELIERIEHFSGKLDYADFAVGDTDGDGVFELVSLERVIKEIPSVKLKVHSFVDDSYKLVYETGFQLGDYPDAVIIGNVSQNQKGIFVELGLGAHSAATEIIAIVDGEYKNVLAHEDEYNFSQTFKPYPLYSQDVNNDGIIEVGVQTEPPAADGYSMADMPWIKNWYQWDGKDGLVKVMVQHPKTEEGAIKPEYAREIIKETADKLIHAISTKNMEMVSEFVHPVKGVRFTPYTHVSLEQDVVFDKETIKKFFTAQESYLWGYYDGTGEEIRLTPSEYYDRFIYSADFINAEAIGYNEVLSSGNMLENQFEVFEDPIVVEYYFSGFEPQYAGMDWESLRLVFEQYEDGWKLTGIIHNQWTI